MNALRALAPGKVNLCLYLGQDRADGLHELVSIVQSVSVADDVELALAPDAEEDEVRCPGIEEPNLAAAALAAFREAAGWAAPPVRVTITKRVPIAGGMGGGSADAAAVLRLAAAASGKGDPALLGEIATILGADVPAALEPGRALVTGAGEHVRRLPAAARCAFLVLPLPERLRTADVFAEADRLALARDPGDLEARRRAVERAVEETWTLPDELIHNDLEPAARSLCPAIGPVLDTAEAAGAAQAFVSGSGPTVIGVFPRSPRGSELGRLSLELADEHPGVRVAVSVDAGFGTPRVPESDQPA